MTTETPVADAVLMAIEEAKDRAGGLDAAAQARAALATRLALELDAGAGMAAAAISRELRATLDTLAPEERNDDDAFARWESDLGVPAEVLYPKD